MKKNYFGAGCFWGAEYEFLKLDGVKETRVGFMGGLKNFPTHEQILDHAEVVEIVYDETIITYDEILDVFWKIHDPTSADKEKSKEIIKEEARYRSIIFFNDEEEKDKATDLVKELNDLKLFDREVITEIKEVSDFYPASKKHQKYFLKKYKRKKRNHLLFRLIIILITFILVLYMKIYL